MARPRFSVVDRAGQPDYKPPLPGPRWAGSAQVAQLVEHATENRSVGGSIPPLGTIPLTIVLAQSLGLSNSLWSCRSDPGGASMTHTFKHAIVACHPDEDSFTLSM